MDKVRFGIIGVGGMGSHHVSYINTVEGAVLTAVCDTDAGRLATTGKGMDVARFSGSDELINRGKVDAVLIATPHYDHCPIARAAFAKGLHVLSEKPQAVSVNDARKANAAYEKVKDKLKYGIMYQARTGAMYQKMRQLIAEGELGPINRVTWIVTTWFRSWAYYASGGWRATWGGEGGGVTINQCPHNFDLLWWIPQMMPSRVTGVASMGKTHPIEVEDEVSAILEYPNGAIGHFVTTTGECPGSDRLEIHGDRGKLVAEKGKLTFSRNRQSTQDVNKNTTSMFPWIESWDIEIPYKNNKPEGHKAITQNFVNAILKDEPLMAPGVEGVQGLEIGNSILMAGLTRKAVELPLDGEAYDAFIEQMKKTYGGRKSLTTTGAAVDMKASWH